MLTNLKLRCIYCRQLSFFYVHSAKSKKAKVCIWTLCSKCNKVDDVQLLSEEDSKEFIKKLTGE